MTDGFDVGTEGQPGVNLDSQVSCSRGEWDGWAMYGDYNTQYIPKLNWTNLFPSLS